MTFLFFSLVFTAGYAIGLSLEVYRLRRKLRAMRSIYCGQCQEQIPMRCPNCDA